MPREIRLLLAASGTGGHLFPGIAVAEAALNVAVAGGKPAAITNCLNFGNPYDPEIFYQFSECVLGMGEACKALDTPVTGGNVSFYNEDPERAVYPTPVIGMVGVVPDVEQVTTTWFKNEGDVIYIIGETLDEIGGSEYLKDFHGLVTGKIPKIDLALHKKHIEFILALISEGLAKSAQDISDGGLAVALAECCFKKRIGAEINLEPSARKDSLLFGETQSRAIISVSLENGARIEELAAKAGVTVSMIGITGGGNLKINEWIDISIEKLNKIYEEAIPKLMEQVTTVERVAK